MMIGADAGGWAGGNMLLMHLVLAEYPAEYSGRIVSTGPGAGWGLRWRTLCPFGKGALGQLGRFVLGLQPRSRRGARSYAGGQRQHVPTFVPALDGLLRLPAREVGPGCDHHVFSFCLPCRAPPACRARQTPSGARTTSRGSWRRPTPPGSRSLRRFGADGRGCKGSVCTGARCLWGRMLWALLGARLFGAQREQQREQALCMLLVHACMSAAEQQAELRPALLRLA